MTWSILMMGTLLMCVIHGMAFEVDWVYNGNISPTLAKIVKHINFDANHLPRKYCPNIGFVILRHGKVRSIANATAIDLTRPVQLPSGEYHNYHFCVMILQNEICLQDYEAIPIGPGRYFKCEIRQKLLKLMQVEMNNTLSENDWREDRSGFSRIQKDTLDFIKADKHFENSSVRGLILLDACKLGNFEAYICRVIQDPSETTSNFKPAEKEVASHFFPFVGVLIDANEAIQLHPYESGYTYTHPLTGNTMESKESANILAALPTLSNVQLSFTSKEAILLDQGEANDGKTERTSCLFQYLGGIESYYFYASSYQNPLEIDERLYQVGNLFLNKSDSAKAAKQNEFVVWGVATDCGTEASKKLKLKVYEFLKAREDLASFFVFHENDPTVPELSLKVLLHETKPIAVGKSEETLAYKLSDNALKPQNLYFIARYIEESDHDDIQIVLEHFSDSRNSITSVRRAALTQYINDSWDLPQERQRLIWKVYAGGEGIEGSLKERLLKDKPKLATLKEKAFKIYKFKDSSCNSSFDIHDVMYAGINTGSEHIVLKFGEPEVNSPLDKWFSLRIWQQGELVTEEFSPYLYTSAAEATDWVNQNFGITPIVLTLDKKELI